MLDCCCASKPARSFVWCPIGALRPRCRTS
jgi:hypothetical protein